MAEFSIDDDWKKQAQEEKRKLAEEQQKKAAAAQAAPVTQTATAATVGAPSPSKGRASAGARGQRETPAPSFTVILNHILTQAFYYLGDLGGQETGVNLEMAKLYIDTLAVLEDKTKGNLNPDETSQLDNALYEVRNRFVSVASKYIL